MNILVLNNTVYRLEEAELGGHVHGATPSVSINHKRYFGVAIANAPEKKEYDVLFVSADGYDVKAGDDIYYISIDGFLNERVIKEQVATKAWPTTNLNTYYLYEANAINYLNSIKPVFTYNDVRDFIDIEQEPKLKELLKQKLT